MDASSALEFLQDERHSDAWNLHENSRSGFLQEPLILNILALSGEIHAAALSKALCMRQWSATQTAFWLVCMHGPSQALVLAASNGRVDICNALLHPSDPGHLSADVDSSHACICAAKSGRQSTCNLVLSLQPYSPALANAKDNALLWAAKHGHIGVCQLLFSTEDAQHQSTKADTTESFALHLAAREGHLAVCELLLQQPYHPALADSHNSWSLLLAAEHGHYQVCELLLSQAVHPARADARNSASLCLAVEHDHLAVCRLLLEQQEHAASIEAVEASVLDPGMATHQVQTAVWELVLRHTELLEGMQAMDILAWIVSCDTGHG